MFDEYSTWNWEQDEDLNYPLAIPEIEELEMRTENDDVSQPTTPTSK